MERALGGLAHRGPDACGMVELRLGHFACLLGHRRLRIIDLSEEADQPMTNEDATVWVSYNGEIYNHRELRADLERSGHRFRSSSDTEVLVHLYEEADGDPGVMLPRLRGMFAFAIADTQRGRLLLSRDRLGIKPLYFEDKAGRLSFGSEVRAVGRVSGAGGEADLEAASGYLVRGVVPGPRTILAGVRELPAHPDVRPALERLRSAGFRLAALTNSTTEVEDAQLRNAGLAEFFEKGLSADTGKRLKPAAEAYTNAARELRVAPAQIRMVAAHAWDVHGAMRAGCAAALVERPGVVWNPLLERPDIVGPDLGEIAERVIELDR